jgi:predicted amidohydrolase YtcJ
VNRVTPQGRILGKYQRLTVQEALSAITIGAAYSMHMDGDVGSIETGKFADFVILGDDPLAVDPMALKDVPVLGTVLGGQVQLL